MVGSDVVDFNKAKQAKEQAEQQQESDVITYVPVPEEVAKEMEQQEARVMEYYDFIMDRLEDKNKEDTALGNPTDIMVPIKASLQVALTMIAQIDKAAGISPEETAKRMDMRKELSDILDNVAEMFSQDMNGQNTYGLPLYHHDVYFSMLLTAMMAITSHQAVSLASMHRENQEAGEDETGEQQTEAVTEESDN